MRIFVMPSMLPPMPQVLQEMPVVWDPAALAPAPQPAAAGGQAGTDTGGGGTLVPACPELAPLQPAKQQVMLGVGAASSAAAPLPFFAAFQSGNSHPIHALAAPFMLSSGPVAASSGWPPLACRCTRWLWARGSRWPKWQQRGTFRRTARRATLQRWAASSFLCSVACCCCAGGGAERAHCGAQGKAQVSCAPSQATKQGTPPHPPPPARPSRQGMPTAGAAWGCRAPRCSAWQRLLAGYWGAAWPASCQLWHARRRSSSSSSSRRRASRRQRPEQPAAMPVLPQQQRRCRWGPATGRRRDQETQQQGWAP